MRHCAPRSSSRKQVSNILVVQVIHLPLCRKPRTRTTTLTLPPGFEGVGVAIGTTTDSLDLSDGAEAEEGVGAREGSG
jgi:hypothetical protein